MRARSKPKVALPWLGSCGGCDEAIVDLGEALLLEIAPQIEIVYWPVALDAKLRQLEALPPGSIAASLVSGAVRTQEMAELLQLVRERSQLLIALGSCAQLGGIPSLANASHAQELLQTAYLRAPSNDGEGGRLPGTGGPPGVRALSPLCETVRPLGDLVAVDFTIPGCPPPSALIAEVLGALLAGKLPPPGHVFGEALSLCHSCPRLPTKPEELRLQRLRRVHEIEADPEVCLLAQGLVCLGPATRGGCGERCLQANMPCRGCFGPLERGASQAASMLSCLAGHAPVEQGEAAVLAYAESLVDPLGSCYRFGLPCDACRPPGEDGQKS